MHVTDTAPPYMFKDRRHRDLRRVDHRINAKRTNQRNESRDIDQCHRMPCACSLGKKRRQDVDLVIISDRHKSLGRWHTCFGQNATIQCIPVQNAGGAKFLGQFTRALGIALDDLDLRIRKMGLNLTSHHLTNSTATCNDH